ncbi:MAG TPA: cellulase family glycosylhydrolase [Streptosporangiaceae bacterium]|nr:cellulase family glycosylhydrolase [Streptosporangiaceae bacterium]
MIRGVTLVLNRWFCRLRREPGGPFKIVLVLAVAGLVTGAAPPGLTTRAAHDKVASEVLVTAFSPGRGGPLGLSGAAPQVHATGNGLVTSSGAPVVLHGVDRSGSEYMCVDGYGIFDGPSDQASIAAMKTWDINAVRVPLNEACWNGESYVERAYRGSRYQHAIEAYVRLLNANGLVVILDLHWSDGAYLGPDAGCSSAHATCQKPMPDRGAIRFWSSVSRAFSGNDAVIFDLFNEPFPELADQGDEAEGWHCWRYGGQACVGLGYRAAGMQSLVAAVRSTGATNVIMLGGLNWANDLTRWLAHEPHDPLHDLAASWHSYNFNPCDNQSCWQTQIAPVIAKVPVITGELGQSGCNDSYINSLMLWLDTESASYLAWTWDTWRDACSTGPTLITTYGGHPTPYGAGYRSHLLTLASAGLESHRRMAP